MYGITAVIQGYFFIALLDVQDSGVLHSPLSLSLSLHVAKHVKYFQLTEVKTDCMDSERDNNSHISLKDGFLLPSWVRITHVSF